MNGCGGSPSPLHSTNSCSRMGKHQGATRATKDTVVTRYFLTLVFRSRLVVSPFFWGSKFWLNQKSAAFGSSPDRSGPKILESLVNLTPITYICQHVRCDMKDNESCLMPCHQITRAHHHDVAMVLAWAGDLGLEEPLVDDALHQQARPVAEALLQIALRSRSKK